MSAPGGVVVEKPVVLKSPWRVVMWGLSAGWTLGAAATLARGFHVAV